MQCRALKAVLLAGIDEAVSEGVDMGVEITKRIDGKRVLRFHQRPWHLLSPNEHIRKILVWSA